MLRKLRDHFDAARRNWAARPQWAPIAFFRLPIEAGFVYVAPGHASSGTGGSGGNAE